MQVTGEQALTMLMIATPAVVGWWIKSSLDKLDEIKVLSHRVTSLRDNVKELKGEMKTLVEMGKAMAVQENKTNTLFHKYDELNERLNKINAQIQ